MEAELTSDSLSSEELFADDEALEAKDEDEEQDDMSSSLSVRELFRLRLLQINSTFLSFRRWRCDLRRKRAAKALGKATLPVWQ